MFCRSLLYIFLLFCLSANGQSDRPKVGLVLSGGSAHGLAHIGVLQYLEKAGVHVDYITGTSMGAVIGGLYAMGYDPDEIEGIARDLNWELMMSNRSPLNEVSPAEKNYHEKIPFSLLWNDNSFKFPLGLIRGQKLDLLISNTFSPAYFIDDFDELTIPFRCVAVDLEDGSVKIFDSGYLGEAIRASMAIPSVFPPKEIDDKIYVDGGLIRNFPVDEVKAMGADIVIGVYVGSKKEGKDKLNTLFEILRQSTSMASILDSEQQSKRVDILIEPDVKEFGSFEFAKCNTFITRGFRAAQKMSVQINQLVDSLSHFEKPLVRIKLDRPQKVQIADISTTKTTAAYEKMIRNKLKFEPHSTTSLDKIEESVALVYGTKNFSKASYSFYKKDGAHGLKIDTKEVDPYTVGLSINRFKFYNMAFILSGEARNVFGQLSRVHFDARLSENPGIQVDYLLRFPNSPSYYFNVKSKWDKYELPFYSQNTIDRLYRYNESFVDFSINKEWKNTYMFAFGYSFNMSFFEPQIFKANDVNKYRTNRNEMYVSLDYNSLDRSVFPDKGWHAHLNLSRVFNNTLNRSDQSPDTDFLIFPEDKNFFIADFSLSYFLRTKGMLCHEFYIKSSISSGKSLTRAYKVGGPIQEKTGVYGFLGLDDSQLIIGDHVSLKYALRLPLNADLFIAPAIQFLHGKNYLFYAFQDDKITTVLSYGLIFGMDSPLGPIVLDMGISDLTERFVVNFGIGFRHIM